MPGAGKALLRSSVFLAGTDQWVSFPQLTSSSNHSCEEVKRWEASLPPQGSQMPALRSSWPSLVDLHSQAPFSKHLSAPHQTASVHTGVQLPGNLPDGGHRGQTVPAVPPPPTGVCSKDHRGGCPETRRLKFRARSDPHRAARRASLDPTVARQQDKSSSLESIFTKQAQLARTQPWKECSLDFQHTRAASPLDDVKWAGLVGTSALPSGGPIQPRPGRTSQSVPCHTSESEACLLRSFPQLKEAPELGSAAWRAERNIPSPKGGRGGQDRGRIRSLQAST